MQPTLFLKCEACGGYFDGRDLGAVLEPPPIRHAIKCSSVAGSSGGGVRRRDGGGTTRPYKFEGTHEAALGVASLNSAPCSSL